MSRTTFEGTIVAGSAKSILFLGVYWDAPMWIPRSQAEVEPDEEGVVVKVSSWLSKKRGLEEFRAYSAEEMEKFNAF